MTAAVNSFNPTLKLEGYDLERQQDGYHQNKLVHINAWSKRKLDKLGKLLLNGIRNRSCMSRL